MPKPSESRWRVPHTLVLLFALIVAAQILTYLLPQGRFERVEGPTGREQVVPDTFQRVEEPEPLGPLAFLTAIPRGFEAAQGIIFFVFIVGGAFAVLRATGAVDATIGVLLRRLAGRPALLIAGGMLLFAVGSSTIGMAEEYLPFVPILLVLAAGLRLDAVTGVAILTAGYAIGYGAAAINPFTVMVAQEVSGLAPTSGWPFRVVFMAVLLPVGVHHVWRYARRVQEDPAKSLVADLEPPAMVETDELPAITARHLAALGLLVAAIVVLVAGLVYGDDWYLVEMGAIFIGLTLALAVVAGLSPDRTAKAFCVGAAELTTTALLIGFARTIAVILEEGQVIDTIVHGLSLPLQHLGAGGAAVGMMVVQTVINFFVPSGSGQAYVTMPLMAPLSDLLEIPRQVAVLAYQIGDGFANILVPTNAVLIGILAMSGIPYERWLRFVLPLLLKLWAIGALALLVAVWIGYS
jgi:uncharacterized ion transporter superfamily protein YfcC